MSKNKIENKVWGIFVSENTKKYPDLNLKNERILIGRNKNCTIQINDKRLSGVHLEINLVEDQVKLTDRSTNGCYLNNVKMNLHQPTNINQGDIIALLHKTKVGKEQDISFKFNSQIILKNKQEVEKVEKVEKEEQRRKGEEIKEVKSIKEEKELNKIGEEMHCCICLEIIHECVTGLDCLHSFCGGCLSEWLKKNKDCPHCRLTFTAIKKNPLINNIIQSYLAMHPHHKRDQKELDLLHSQNTFQTDKLILSSGKSNKQRKAQAELQQQQQLLQQQQQLMQQQQDLRKCLQCGGGQGVDGFQCSSHQTHVSCYNCQRQMPARQLDTQECAMCKQVFCSLYYKQQCVAGERWALLAVEDYPVGPVTGECLNGNKYEAQLLQDHLRTNNIDIKQVFNQSVHSTFKYSQHRSILRNYTGHSHYKYIKPSTLVCKPCFKLLHFQVIFQYALSIRQLPSALPHRPDCFYGINCNTMVHKNSHALNYNHIALQTKF